MNFNGRFWVIMGRILDMIMVSAFFVLCCIPVVTVIPSAIALYYTTAKCIRHDVGYVYKEFFSAFRNNLKQGILLNLIYLLIAYILYEIKVFYEAQGISATSLGGVYFVFYLVAIFMIVCITFYLIPTLSRFKVKLRGALMLSLYFGVHNLPTMIPMVITFAGAAALAYWSLLTLIFVPGFYAYLMTRSVEKTFRKYILSLPDAGEHSGMWYMEDERKE